MSNDALPGAKHSFAGLDFLRGVAALSVVFVHSGESVGAPWLMPNGWLAVDVFFVISGFVIAHAYDHRLLETGTLGFLKIRLVRLYPLYLLGLAIGIVRLFALYLGGSGEISPLQALLAIICGLGFLPSVLTPGITPINGPAWSLLFEVYINTLYAVVFPFLSRFVLFSVVVVSAFGLISLAMWGDVQGGPNWNKAYVGAVRIAYSFPLGILIYRLRLVANEGRVLPLLACVSAAACFMLPGGKLYQTAFILVMSPAIVICAVGPKSESPISRYCGYTSYFVYAVHSPLLMLGSGVANRMHFPILPVVAALLLALLISSPFVNRHVDVPARDKLRQLL